MISCVVVCIYYMSYLTYIGPSTALLLYIIIIIYHYYILYVISDVHRAVDRLRAGAVAGSVSALRRPNLTQQRKNGSFRKRPAFPFSGFWKFLN